MLSQEYDIYESQCVKIGDDIENHTVLKTKCNPTFKFESQNNDLWYPCVMMPYGDVRITFQ